MDDMIYCVNAECPYKDCSRSVAQFDGDPEKRKAVNTANWQGICKRYAYSVANKEV